MGSGAGGIERGHGIEEGQGRAKVGGGRSARRDGQHGWARRRRATAGASSAGWRRAAASRRRKVNAVDVAFPNLATFALVEKSYSRKALLDNHRSTI